MSSPPRTRRTLARLLVAVTAFNYAVITSKGAEQASSSLGGGAIPGFPSAPGIAPPIEARHAILPGQKIQPEEISDLTSTLKFGQFQPFRLQFDPVYYTGDRSFPYRHSLPYARTTTSSSSSSPSGSAGTGTSGSTGAAEQIVVEEFTGTTTATGGSTPKRERVLPLIAPFLNETYLVAVYSVSYCAPEKSTNREDQLGRLFIGVRPLVIAIGCGPGRCQRFAKENGRKSAFMMMIRIIGRPCV
eukprot:g15125.t1